MKRRYAMKNCRGIGIGSLAVAFLLSGWCNGPLAEAQTPEALDTQYEDPTRFEKDIREFELQDQQQALPREAILCTGSSTIKKWHSTIHEDLAPLTIIARGFGGSTMHDLLHYADRIVIPYRPRAIVVYEGDNDVAKGITPEKIRDTFREFVRKVHHTLPKTRIYFLAIKPSPKRWTMWPTMKKANQLIAEDCSQDARLTYVDITAAMLDAEGTVRGDLFDADNLHLNRAGYEILRNTLLPILEKGESKFESQRKVLVR